MAKRNVKYRQEDLESEHVREPVKLTDLKVAWLEAVVSAELWLARLPVAEVGCLYLDASGVPFAPDPADARFSSIKRHFGCVRGTWPKLA